MLIDSHAHIYLSKFEDDIDEVIERALHKGVQKILMPNIDPDTVEPMLELTQRYPGVCYPMLGLHPCSVDRHFEKQLYKLENWLKNEPFIAIGEIGTDLYWDQQYEAQQKEAFLIQISWAKEHGLPIVIHNRSSFDLTYQLVSGEKDDRLKGVFHCFTGTKDDAEKIDEIGFHIGIGGVLTFKNSGLDAVAPDLNPLRIMLETDSPYLAPAPNRGKRNEPSYLADIAIHLANITNRSLDDIKEATTTNAKELFNLD